LLELVLQRGADDNTTIQIVRYGVETLSKRVRRTSNISPIPKEIQKDLSSFTDTDPDNITLSFSWSELPFLWKIRSIIFLFILVFLCGYLAIYFLTCSDASSALKFLESFSPQAFFLANIGVTNEMSILPS